MIGHDNSTAIANQQSTDPRWFAVHTSANQERTVAIALGQRGVEHFLPRYQSVRRWSDRRVLLDLPLFPGYLFVRIASVDRLRVLQVPRVAQLVGFGGQPVPLPDEEIEALRRGLSRTGRVEPHPYLTAGRHVRVIDGPFEGTEGILLRRKNSLRVVVSLELIMRSVSIEVDETVVEPIQHSRQRRASGFPLLSLDVANVSRPSV